MKSSNTLKRVKFRIPSPDPPPSATVTPLDWLATRPRAIRPSPRTTHRDPVPYRQANFEACTLSASPNYSAITCYGTPRSERRRKSSERQKPNGDVVHATVRMESPRRPLASPGGTSAVECSQITPRLIALTFPSSDSDAAYRTSIREISDHLKKLYHDNYKVFNVSQKRSDLGRSNPVVELGWPERLAPPLDRLCSICKHIETFLQAAPEHVLVLHCKGGRSRAAIVVAAYMHYTSICSSEDSVADRFSMQMFAEKFLRADGQPSHRRYVTYFSNLLSGTTRVNQTPIFLSQCSFQRLGGRAVTLKIYERMKPVFSSGLVVLEESTRFALEAPLSLRGDVLVKCFRKGPGGDRAPFFQCQFNTCALEMSNNNALSLAFFKDELDLLCEDTSVENRATVEFVFLLEPPKGELEKQRKSLSEFSRADSYENFDKPEDDRSASEAASSAPIYSEIQRNSVAPSSVSSSLPTAADGTDSGISSDSPKFQKEGAMPPIPPPKPRRTSVSEDAEEGSVTRQHSVLPAGLRPVAHRPPTPTEGGRVTPRIEPDLVAKDRYDPSSKCFSYVPAKSLNEHFTSPKKPPARRLSEERSVIEPPPEALKESFRNLTFSTSDLSRRPETPKWEEQIEKAAADRYRVEPPRSASIDPEYRGLHSLAELELLSRTNGVVHEDVEEKPVIMNQAKKATKTKRKTKYGSYRTLNDDAYNSDMDELCDPDFYLSYTPTASAPTASAPTPSSGASVSQNGSKSVELPRKSFREVPPRDLDELSDFAEPTTPHRRSCITPKPFSAPYDDEHRNSEAFRYRNCRSVTSTPLLQGRKLFAHDRYDSLADAEHADDWLSAQLRKVRQKRNNDPEVLKRKKQEKILLEELKNAHSDRELVRGRAESDYSIEGVGQRSVDPLLDYQHEEQRLKETRSPFPERPSDLGRGVFDGPRRVMPPSARDAQRPVVRSKPPTPPPRERSRSPPRSPFGGRRLQTPTSTESAYRQERSVLQRTEDALTDDEDDGEFSHLKSLVQDNRSRLEQRFETPTTKSILKRRDTAPSPAVSSADLYASPSTLRHSQTPVEESKRSETPAFPVSRRGETPLPFHPLLYHGASSQPNGSAAHHSFTHRSASPRSFYYGGAHSRRSSMTSIDAGDVIHHHPVFVKDTSKYWYKPTISREEAINMLRDKPPGTFVVRDSNSFPGAFGLALKVATPPPGVAVADGTELVRHFLIEPSPKGVKLKGCNNEPVFGTLSALVYQHSITPLALPTKLTLPEFDPAATPEHLSATQALLEQGAACNVVYIFSCDTESLTGPEAVRRCTEEAFRLQIEGSVRPVSAHFKVSSQGITITDNTRKLFFRRHYPVHAVTHAGLDPDDRRWDNTRMTPLLAASAVKKARLFGFVARKVGSRTDNACHLFAELDPDQPAQAVCNFITKVMMSS